MKFNKQIFTILILSLLVSLAASGCVTQGEKETNATEANSGEFSNIMKNPVTPWSPEPTTPVIDPTAFIHPQAQS